MSNESKEVQQATSYGECPRAASIEFGERITVAPAWKDSGVKLSLHWLVVSFFLLSAFFQMLMAVMSTIISPPTIRFCEYSISAAVMIVAIALQIGIMHTHTLILLATLTWATRPFCASCKQKNVRAARRSEFDSPGDFHT